jgi:hypothetical protein
VRAHEPVNPSGSPCSPARTRLPPLPRCRAPDAGAGFHGEGAPALLGRRWLVRRCASQCPARLASPKWKSTELTRQLLGRASRSHQIDHLSPELRRIGGSITRHQTPRKSTSRGSTKPGQLQLAK